MKKLKKANAIKSVTATTTEKPFTAVDSEERLTADTEQAPVQGTSAMVADVSVADTAMQPDAASQEPEPSEPAAADTQVPVPANIDPVAVEVYKTTFDDDVSCIKALAMAYYNSDSGCSAEALFHKLSELNVLNVIDRHAAKMDTKRLIQDAETIRQCAKDLWNNYHEKHDAVRKRLDEVLDRYTPNLREEHEKALKELSSDSVKK